MAIEPINISGFSRSTSGVEAILARGTSALDSVTRNAIQVGRDQANLQAGQERDLITEQRREVNLKQRRSEEARDNFEDDRAFSRGVAEFDTQQDLAERRFSADTEDRALGRALQARGLDIQSENSQVSRLDALSRIKSREEADDLRGEEFGFRRDAASRDAQFDDARLKQLNLDIEAQKDARKVGELKTARDAERGKQQSLALNEIDRLLKEGNQADAQTIFRTVVENPNFGFTDASRKRLASQVGLGEPQGGEGLRGAGTTLLPSIGVDLPSARRELAILEEAQVLRGDDATPSSADAQEIARLRRLIRDAEADTPEGRKSEADRLRERSRRDRGGN